jgi:hypothetical protein
VEALLGVVYAEEWDVLRALGERRLSKLLYF